MPVFFANKSASSLNFKSLNAGTNITLTPTSNTITISAPSLGDVTGPSSATDTAIAVFNGTTGKTIKNSTATIDGSGNMVITGAATIVGATSVKGGNNLVVRNTGDTTNLFSISGSDGNTNIAGTLGVTGTTTLAGSLAANGGITVNTDKFVVNGTTGATTLTGATANFALYNGTTPTPVKKFEVLSTSGNTSIAGTLDVATAITLPTTGYPIDNNQATTKLYVDSIAEGLIIKPTCRLASTVAVCVGSAKPTGELTIDGSAVVTNNPILLKNETGGAEKWNGIWLANTAGDWTRPTYFDAGQQAQSSFTFISSGTTNISTAWVCTSAALIDTDPITFTQFGGMGSIILENLTGGDGSIYRDYAASTYYLRSLKKGTNIAITQDDNNVTIGTENSISLSGTLGVTGLSTLGAIGSTGDVNVNASGSAATNLGAGTGTGTVNIGNGSAGAALIASGTSAGVSSPITTITGTTTATLTGSTTALVGTTAARVNETGSGTTTIGNSAGGTVNIQSNIDSAITIGTAGESGSGNLNLNAGTGKTITLTAPATTITGGALTLNSSTNTYTLPTTRGGNGQFLKLNDDSGTVVWGTISGTGDVTGPSSSTDTAIALFNETTGKVIKNSNATIDGSGNAILSGTLTIPVGSVSTPSLNFTGSTTTGLYLTPNMEKSGNETQVNATHRSYFTQRPSMAFLSDNSALATWIHGGAPFNVYARKINSSGIPIGSDIQINSSNTSWLDCSPCLAILSDNSALITWINGNSHHVYVHKIDSSGTPIIGDDIQISSAHPASESQKIARLSDNSALILWTERDSPYNIYMRKINSSGTPISDEIQVNSSHPSSYMCSSQNIATLSDNAALVTWVDFATTNIYMRKIDATGTPVGSDIQVNIANNPRYFNPPGIAVLSDDSALVAWTSASSPYNVYMRKVDSSGEPTGSDIQVNLADAPSSWRSSCIAQLSDDSALVAWTIASSPYNVYMRKVDSSGTPIGSDIQVGTSGQPTSPALAIAHSILVSWIDGTSYNIYMQQFIITASTLNAAIDGTNILSVNANGCSIVGDFTAAGTINLNTSGSDATTIGSTVGDILTLDATSTATIKIAATTANPNILIGAADLLTDKDQVINIGTGTINASGTPTKTINIGTGANTAGTRTVNIGTSGAGTTTTILGPTNLNVSGTAATNLGNASSAVYSLSVLNNTGSGTTVDVLADTGQLVAHSSSQRFKDNIEPISDYSSAIAQLNPVTFNYKNDPTKTKQIGLIAEEVEKIIPELVVRDKTGAPFSVKYTDLTTLLLHELQKHQKTIGILTWEIASLKKQQNKLAQN